MKIILIKGGKTMSLKEYFKNTEGLGVIATSSYAGETSAAIYARPHVIDEETIAFIMADTRSHQNILSNPNATYIFHEQGDGYRGKRLQLTKISEERDQEKINRLRRDRSEELFDRYKEIESNLVYFHVDRERPLVGDA